MTFDVFFLAAAALTAFVLLLTVVMVVADCRRRRRHGLWAVAWLDEQASRWANNERAQTAAVGAGDGGAE